MNYWYVARANEIFIDTDNFARSMQHTKMRLQGAIEYKKLDVAYVMQRPSRSKNHVHTIITLKNDLPAIQRAVWALVLHSDIYRSACTIMRSCYAVPAPDILISPYELFYPPNNSKYAGIGRMCDHSCMCKNKHTAAVIENCNAALNLRGSMATKTFFGKPSRNKCEVWP